MMDLFKPASEQWTTPTTADTYYDDRNEKYVKAMRYFCTR